MIESFTFEAYSKENIHRPLLIYYRYNRLSKLFSSFFRTNKNISICEQPKENWKELLKILKHSPTTGMAAIFDILKCNPKELYITGFTFGKDVKHKSYVDKYYKFFTPEKNIVNDKGYAGDHYVASEFILTKKLIQNHKNVVLDSYLQEKIFHLNK